MHPELGSRASHQLGSRMESYAAYQPGRCLRCGKDTGSQRKTPLVAETRGCSLSLASFPVYMGSTEARLEPLPDPGKAILCIPAGARLWVRYNRLSTFPFVR